jgi:parallel beta-helix repeat protein
MVDVDWKANGYAPFLQLGEIFMKKNSAFTRGLWVLLLLFVLSAHASAATRYVSNSGSDASNDCLSFGSPCATITHAAGQASAGDTILLDTGTYTQTALINQSVILDGSGATLEGAIRLAANDITLSNLTISGGATVLGETAGIYIDGGSSGHLISNINLQGTGLPAARAIIIGANASDISISDSQLNGWTSGIYINPSPNANITISGNTISNNVAGIGGDNYSGVTISENDFIGNDEGIGYSGTAAGPTIVDNTFSGNTVIVQSYGDAQLDVEAIAANNTFGTSVLNLTQGSAYSSIQAGIDAASDNDVLQASAGTFEENLNFSNRNGLTLLGAQAGIGAGVDGPRDADSTTDESILIGTLGFGGSTPTINGLTIDGFRLQSTAMVNNGARINGTLELRNLIADFTTTYFLISVGTGSGHELVLTDSTISGERGFTAGNGQLTSVIISGNVFNQTAASLISASAPDGVVTVDGNVFNGPRSINILTNGNQFTNNVFNVGGGQLAIALYEVTDNLIAGNVFNADDSIGMAVIAGGRNEPELLNTISNNQFLGDNADGIVNSLSKLVDASCNWWGDDSGAGGEGPGSGTPVSENVNTIPWNLEPSGQCFGANSDLMLEVGPGLPLGVPEDSGWDHFTAQLTNEGDLVPENVVLWIEVDGIADADVVGGLTVELFDGSNWGSLGWGGASAWNISRDAWFIGRGPTEVVGFEIPAGYDETLPLRVNWPNGTYSATISIESLDSADGAGLPGERIYLTQTEALLVQTEAVANVYVDSGFAGSSNGDALVFTMPDALRST